MSFDLYLFPSSGAPVDASAFAALFAGRYGYEASASEAVYQNPDSGVYFVFDLVVPDAEEGAEAAREGDPRFGKPHIGFTLNLSRPDFFGLEAAAELSALIARRAFAIYDPQADSNSAAFSTTAFLASWRKSNAWASGLARQQKPPVARQPMDANRRVWEWNYARRSLAASLGEDVFVPKILLISGPVLRRAFVWTLGIPTVIPPIAEWVLVIDDVSGTPDKPDVVGVISSSVVQPIARPLGGHADLRILPAASREAVPGALRLAQPLMPGSLLSPDSVYDAETLAG